MTILEEANKHFIRKLRSCKHDFTIVMHRDATEEHVIAYIQTLPHYKRYYRGMNMKLTKRSIPTFEQTTWFVDIKS